MKRMKPAFAALAISFAAALVLSACGGKSSSTPSASNLTGKWTFDRDASLAEVEAAAKKKSEGLANLTMPMLRKATESVAASLELASDQNFKLDLAMTFMGQPKQAAVAGTWKVQGSAIELSAKTENGQAAPKTIPATLEDGKLKLSYDKVPLVFRRA